MVCQERVGVRGFWAARTEANQNLEFRLGLGSSDVALERLNVRGALARECTEHKQSREEPDNDGERDADGVTGERAARHARGVAIGTRWRVVDKV